MAFLDTPWLSLLLISWACLGLALLMRKYTWRDNHLPLPPGPPGEFLLGHLRKIPKENTAATYAQWSKKYKSDVIHVKSLGQSIIVLNSLRAAKELLDKKGAIYSDRPRFTLFEEMGWKKTLTFLPYGECWQMHRKMLQTDLSNTNVRQWQPFQLQECRRTINNMLCNSDWENSLRRFTVAIVLKVSYGTDVFDENDPYIKIANDAMYAMGNGGAPANSIVEVFPLARYLPNWLLRDWPLKFARDWKWAIQTLHEVPFSCAYKDVVSCDNVKFTADRMLTRTEEQCQNWTLEDIKGAAGAVFIAGADTTWATCVIFILNMVLNPEVQRKAHEQLDLVVGRDRLPNFGDRPNLPYIEWIVQEVYRWSPLAPLGIPHKSVKNDVYNGMHIPKAMGRDERVYHDPASFQPERYRPIEEGGPGEPFPVAHFGFGRRICVGRFLADNSVWIMICTMLATLRFQKKTDADGNVMPTRVEFTNGGTCHPMHFECTIQPRTNQTLALVSAAPNEFGQRQVP
ncbi:cytochrome P450 [Stachybotrys elegans]|uniref:Cytochrome P450 n=1 Tax=Stachybotrys elegans TaxID=80388 RepID=A0A8K0T3J6_9HYPO|nr:cytochrome P450 [Stachybotrys elegans]